MRKTLSLLLAVVLAATLAIANVAMADQAQTELVFWTRINDTFEDEIAAFEEMNPGVKIVRVGVGSSYDDLVMKYVAAAVSGDMPHVGLLSQRYGIPQIYDADVLVPIEDFMTEDEQNDIMNAYWERYTYKGKRVAVPFQSSMPVLYVNLTLLNEAGLEIPTTWDEIIIAAKALTKDVDSDGATDVYGFNLPDDAPWYVNSLVSQSGGTIIHDDGSVTVNTDEMKSVLTSIQKLVADGSMPANQHGTAKDDFKNGALAMMLCSCASYKNINGGVDGKFEWAMSTYPSIGGNIMAPIGGNALGVFKSNDEMEALAWEFVKFMTSSDAVSGFTMNKGYLPIKYSFMDTDFVKARLNDSIWTKTFEQVQFLKGQPVNPVDATIWKDINDILSEIESDTDMDITGLLEDMQLDVDDFLMDY